MSYLGIDVAKETVDVTLLTQDGPKHQRQFKNNQGGYKALLKWLKERVSPGSQIQAVMEATNIYWEELADYLYEQGLRVSVVNPAAIKGFAQSQLQRTKTDRQDSWVIAKFGQLTTPKAWQPPQPHQRKLRALERHKLALQKTRTQQLNRLASCRDADVKTSLQELSTALDNHLAQIELKIQEVIENHSDLKAKQKLLTSIKGIGLSTANLILAEFYDLNHYDTAKAVAADAGVTPTQHQSGTSVRRKPSISRVGKAAVRAGLYLPAKTAIRFNPLVKELAQRLEKRGKPYPVILVAAIRKLLHIAYGVLKHNRPFDPFILSPSP